MRPSPALRRALTATAGTALALTLVPAIPAAARPAPSGEAEVRLVVRTTTRAAGLDLDGLTDLVERRGARPAGRVRQLRALALDVPRSSAESLRGALLRREDVTSVEVAARRWLTDEPSDPHFGEQRAYLDAVRATSAWARPARGAATVRIGIVDSGVDVTHPDLAPKLAGTFNATTRGTDVRDLVGHGTGVASVAAAATNNGEGIAGAGYDSTLLVAKVADRTGRIFTDDLAAGIVWAVDSGADVINLSLGGPSSDRLERDAIAYAQARGVLIVAAAGNDGTRTKQYPAALPEVLSVGAASTDGSSRVAFSSFGSWVDVAAPGRGLLVANPGGGYAKADGTSFAAPLVAGQVALLEAYRPGRSATELAAAVMAGANGAKLGFARGLVDFDASLDLLPPAGAPTLTAPADGATVHGTTTVTASSTAPRVRLAFADLTTIVSTQDGVASASFPTYGLAGPQAVSATDCSSIDQCGAATASSTAVVANPAPALTAPAEGSDASADTIDVAAEAPADAAVRFLLDGSPAATDTTAPFRATVSTERLSDGSHRVAAVLCRRDGSVCDAGTASGVTVGVDRLHPRIAATSTPYLSPDGNGRKDTVTVRYRLESRQAVTLRVRNAARTVVFAKRLGTLAAGAHTAGWDGRGDSGAVVPDGAFTLEVSTREPDGSQVGLATRPVTVDRTAPRVGRVATEVATVFPVRDRYRDQTALTTRLDENARWVQVQAQRTGGPAVLAARVARVAAGPVRLTWDARSRSGTVLPPGSYRVRVLAQDAAGNRSRSAPVTVEVSGQRLARRTGSVSVTARESLRETFTDECSLVFRHTEGPRRGWVGYYSSGICTSGDAYAVGDHQVQLPRAVRYGTVRVSAYGGRGDPKYRDSAVVTYYDRLQNLSEKRFRLAPRVDTYPGPRAAATPLLIRRRVLRWSTMTTGVQWYDVERYTVRYTYFVLR